jgi:hypothetical protein
MDLDISAHLNYGRRAELFQPDNRRSGISSWPAKATQDPAVLTLTGDSRSTRLKVAALADGLLFQWIRAKLICAMGARERADQNDGNRN